MPAKVNKKYFRIIAIIFGVGFIGATVAYAYNSNKNETRNTATTNDQATIVTEENGVPSADSVEPYEGTLTSVANEFTIKVPNGWRASISENTSFRAIMFARPNQIESLIYDTSSTPVIDRDGIPSWNGLTEHFFVIKPTPGQAFNPNDHLEVSSQPFIFNDGTAGQKYYVVKHVDEAQKWGGLQKDSEWQGRTYIYEKDGKKVEAHLALYPSTGINTSFFEDVIRTLSF